MATEKERGRRPERGHRRVAVRALAGLQLAFGLATEVGLVGTGYFLVFGRELPAYR